jgi:hypothetical protein
VDDVLKRGVGPMISRFEFAGGLEVGVRAVVKEAVGQRGANALVEQREE